MGSTPIINTFIEPPSPFICFKVLLTSDGSGTSDNRAYFLLIVWDADCPFLALCQRFPVTWDISSVYRSELTCDAQNCECTSVNPTAKVFYYIGCTEVGGTANCIEGWPSLYLGDVVILPTGGRFVKTRLECHDAGPLVFILNTPYPEKAEGITNFFEKCCAVPISWASESHEPTMVRKCTRLLNDNPGRWDGHVVNVCCSAEKTQKQIARHS